MTIPNATSCIVDQEKVRDYLLKLSHPAGKSKAAFFTAMGFDSRTGRYWPKHYARWYVVSH